MKRMPLLHDVHLPHVWALLACKKPSSAPTEQMEGGVAAILQVKESTRSSMNPFVVSMGLIDKRLMISLSESSLLFASSIVALPEPIIN